MGNDTWRKRNCAEKKSLAQAIGLEAAAYLDMFEDTCHELHRLLCNGGFLSNNGTVPTDEEAASMIGVPVEKHTRLLNLLLNQNLIQKDNQGVLFSPALSKEISIRETRRQEGKKGGNPILLNQMLNQPSCVLGSSDDVPPEGESEGEASFEDKLFAILCENFPKRLGGNPKKAARTQMNRRMADTSWYVQRENTDEDEVWCLISSVLGYKRYCEFKRIVGTEYVMQMKRFFSDELEFMAFIGWEKPVDDAAHGIYESRELREGR